MHKLIVIVGPTAIGKSAAAVEVASMINGEVISADSVQVYKGMDIGSGKISFDETKAFNGKIIQHHLIDILSPNEEFSVALFKLKVENLIPEIAARGNIPILVGGTGLYIEAIIDSYKFPKFPKDDELRSQLNEQAINIGNEYLYEKLIKVDPISAAKIHPNDLRRVIRALEVHYLTGTPISAAGSRSPGKKGDKYNLTYIGLETDREYIYDNINQRVDLMFERGLVNEVKQLLDAGFDPELPSLQSLGYRQVIDYLSGNLNYEMAINLIKRDTRRYAKRQLTWFKRDSRIIWYNIKQYQNKIDLAKDIIEQYKGI